MNENEAEFVYKIVTLKEFQDLDFQSSKLWTGSEFDKSDGFIHLSSKAHAVSVANRFFSAEPSIKLLKFSIHDMECPDELKWEQGDMESTELCPHLYGGLNLKKCVEKIDWQKSKESIYKNL
jgi:uncharacterized protein (DUF952 family)